MGGREAPRSDPQAQALVELRPHGVPRSQPSRTSARVAPVSSLPSAASPDGPSELFRVSWCMRAVGHSSETSRAAGCSRGSKTPAASDGPTTGKPAASVGTKRFTTGTTTDSSISPNRRSGLLAIAGRTSLCAAARTSDSRGASCSARRRQCANLSDRCLATASGPQVRMQKRALRWSSEQAISS